MPSGADMQNRIESQVQIVENRRADLENIKRAILTELGGSLPAMIDFRIREIIEINPSLIQGVSDSQLADFKKQLAAAKEQSVKRVLDQLSVSPYWFDCGKEGQFEKDRLDRGGSLFRIIQSIEDEFLPILTRSDIKRKYTSGGKTDIFPQNIAFLPSVKLAGLAGSYEQFLSSFCESEETLATMRNSLNKA